MDAGEAQLSTEAAARLTYIQVILQLSGYLGCHIYIILYFQIERDQKKTTRSLEGKKAESAARLGMGLGGMR